MNIKRVPHLKPFFLFTATVRLKFMLQNVMKIIICDFIDLFFVFSLQLVNMEVGFKGFQEVEGVYMMEMKAD